MAVNAFEFAVVAAKALVTVAAVLVAITS
jgi:hypothetical protein